MDSDDNYIEPFSINSVLSARLTMSSKASREERRATARRHFTMSGKPELLPSLQSWLGQRRHPGQWGHSHYYTGCVGSLNQYEIASFMRVVSVSVCYT